MTTAEEEPSSQASRAARAPSSASCSFFRRGDRARLPSAGGLAVGRVLGDYRLVALIGQGGMGQVWEAEQLSLGGRRVALKVVRPERASEKRLELFAREARAGGRLAHPGIVTLHEQGSSEGLAWIAMELVEGAWTLRDFLDEVMRTGELPEDYDRHVARFVAEIADAVQAAHEAGVIHRDLKPHNVLVTVDDRPKVTDFGLARITGETALSQTGEVAGTYLYMSPEQVVARRMGIDHRTDVFSLGVVLYETLALQRPFQGDTEHQVAEQIMTKDPPDPRTFRSRVPHDLAVIAGKALEKDRDKRFQSMREFAADLRRFLAHEPIRARPPTPLERAVKWARRNPTRSTAAAIAAVAFAAISTLLFATTRARDDLARANRALSLKTALAESKADEVLRLSALQKLDDLVAEADGLWPAAPENLEAYEGWLRRARRLIEERPEHEKTLAELRAKASPRSAEERARARSAHPRLAELERLQRHLAYLRAPRPLPEPPPESGPPAGDAAALNLEAWTLVDPARTDWGGEGRGLALARRALAQDGLTPSLRASLLDTLAWALIANGRFDEALTEEQRALAMAPAVERKPLEDSQARMRAWLAREADPARAAERSEELAALEQRRIELEGEIESRGDDRFADAEDKWWCNQLEKLVSGLVAFSSTATGLAEGEVAPGHGWSVRRRAEFARTIAQRSLTGPEPALAWEEARASIADVAERPWYRGLGITPQLGLLPIGPDPDSGLWEFAHLQSGEPARRGPDGRLVLHEGTGLVFVLLPGGRFRMGAQARDPAGANHDPSARLEDGPVHEVTLAPFFLSKYEMTQGQWLRCTGENPSNYVPGDYNTGWLRVGDTGGLLHPVETVSWVECGVVLARLGLALPSEEQWEYGARAGTSTVWWCGDERDALGEVGNLADLRIREAAGDAWRSWEDWDDGSTVHACVGSYAPNGFGLHDTIGNVWEWCQDELPPGTPDRATRGGGFGNPADSARSSSRDSNAAEDVDSALGVRPMRAVTP